MGSAVAVISNVILAIITGWYAYLTLRIARASRLSANAAEQSAAAAEKAAKASEVAADATRWSAAVALASLIVNFQMRPAYSYMTAENTPAQPPEEPRFNLGVRLRVTDANVFIHSVTLRDYFRLETTGPPIWKRESDGVRDANLRFGIGRHAPSLLAHGEEAEFWTSDAWVPMDYVASMFVLVEYSLDGSSETRTRALKWEGTQEEDFRFWGPEPQLAVRRVEPSTHMSTFRST